MPLPIESIRSQFPIFTHQPELVYLDNAATSQKPQSVIDTINQFYEKENANIHRGIYELSFAATQRFEETRKKVARLLGTQDSRTIAFTKGTTESINIIAKGLIKEKLREGDNIVISGMEHHANLVPWQQICFQHKAVLRIIPVSVNGELALSEIEELLDRRTRLLAITQISNVLGTINPVDEIIAIAHKKNIPVLVDAAQSVGHYPVDVEKSEADFLAFSAHKMFGPLGTGVLYCRESFQPEIEPLNYGGGGIKNVEFSRTTFMDYPHRLEAGTPNIPGVIGLGTAVDFVEQLDLAASADHEKILAKYFKDELLSTGGFALAGNPTRFGGIVSFTSEKIHPHDIAGFLANERIAVRAGHHCCQPLLESMGIHATVRVSFSVYNTKDDVDRTIESLRGLKLFWS